MTNKDASTWPLKKTKTENSENLSYIYNYNFHGFSDGMNLKPVLEIPKTGNQYLQKLYYSVVYELGVVFIDIHSFCYFIYPELYWTLFQDWTLPKEFQNEKFVDFEENYLRVPAGRGRRYRSKGAIQSYIAFF